MRGNGRKPGIGAMVGLATAVVLALPVGVSAADEPTCREEFLLCVNDAAQSDSDTWEGFKCSLEFLRCVRKEILKV